MSNSIPLLTLSALEVDALSVGYGHESRPYPFKNEIDTPSLANRYSLQRQVEDRLIEEGVPLVAHEWMQMQQSPDIRVEISYGSVDPCRNDVIAINGIRKGDDAFVAVQGPPLAHCSGNIQLFKTDAVSLAPAMVEHLPELSAGKRGPFYFDYRPAITNHIAHVNDEEPPNFSDRPAVRSGLAQIRHGHRAEHMLDETAKTVCWCDKQNDGVYILRPTEAVGAGKRELVTEINRVLHTLVAEIREHRNNWL